MGQHLVEVLRNIVVETQWHVDDVVGDYISI